MMISHTLIHRQFIGYPLVIFHIQGGAPRWPKLCWLVHNPMKTVDILLHLYYSGWWFMEHDFFFPYMGNNNLNWLSYFSEGLKPPTSLSIGIIMNNSLFVG